MATKTLLAGDRVYFVQNGLKLRARVADYLPLKTRGEEPVVPVIRRKTCVWKKRSELRKLPERKAHVS